MWNRVLLTALLCQSAFAAQIPAARFQVSGRIRQTGSLSLAASDTGIIPLQASAVGDPRQVHVLLRPSLPARTGTVLLIARSNSPYRLVAKSVTHQDGANPQSLRVLVKSVEPNAGTAHLTPDATSVHAIEGLAVIEGPRISNGGNDATIDNAIRLALEVEFPQDVSEAELIFTMEFPGN